jgi:hypothetical protein
MPMPVHPPRRADAILIRRCRQGDEEALQTLLYRLADELWGAAWQAYQDTAAAQAAVLDAWRMVLRALRGWHSPSWARLRRRALGAAGGAAADGQVLAAPEELLAAMRQAAVEAAPQLAQAARRRAFWHLQAWAVLLALLLGLVMMLVSYQAMGRWHRIPAAVVEGLQFRVRHTALSVTLRELAWQLPDPGGLDRPLVAVLEEAALALDEIANAPAAGAEEQLRYLAWRLRRRPLAALLVQVAEQGRWPPAPLLDSALALEEVENWFTGG